MIDPYIFNSDLEVHLRDARHAHQIATEFGHAFTPKTKFLFHVAFQISGEVSAARLVNTSQFQKQIGVLARSADLPKFRSTVEVKNQYNRKKQIQTRVDYVEVNINFYDDNLGATRAMLEEYYRYYVRDANHAANGMAFDPRDTYRNGETYPNYGLNNRRRTPFFEYIKIYQLSRQEWFSYTLVNPILSAWGHDQVDASDGAGIMENNVTVAYEAVIYDNGIVGEFGEPLGFGDGDTGYDQTPSPLSINPNYNYPISPGLNEYSPPGGYDQLRVSNGPSGVGTNYSQPGNWFDSVVKNIRTPKPDFLSEVDTGARTFMSEIGTGDVDSLVTGLQSNTQAKRSFMAQALNTGEVDGGLLAYEAGDDQTRQNLEQAAFDKLSSSAKLKKMAQDLL